MGLACCLLVACLLLDAQAPPWWSNNLINRLKCDVLQLGALYLYVYLVQYLSVCGEGKDKGEDQAEGKWSG